LNLEISLPQERILVVDDEANIVSSLKEILSDEGYNVSEAKDGLNALDMIRSDPPDLLLLDVWVPGMDGIEVLKTVKTYHPEIEVLVMSGHGTIDTAVKATKLGAFDFIEKPFSMDSLIQSVKNALALKKQTPEKENYDALLGFTSLIETQKAIKTHSQTDCALLLLGEAGTGKEYIAQAIHQKSLKSNLPFIKLNCSSRPVHEINSFLFLSKKEYLRSKNITVGTTSVVSQAVYLDNVDALNKTVQRNLFKSLFSNDSEEKSFLPSRLYISSSKNLDELSKKNQFNRDFLKGFSDTTISIPPLRENPTIIPVLIRNHLEEISQKNGLPTSDIDSDALEVLCQYHWPENIRELHSVLDRILTTASSESNISLNQIPPEINKLTALKERTKLDKLNDLPQKTLKRSVVLYGSGLHKGLKTGLILQPLPPNSGIVFSNISNGQTIPARIENIISTDYSTTLRKGKTSVATIEHIMAVLHMYNISNLLIKVGEEVPVMDGSSKDFCKLIEDGGIEEQNEPLQELIVDKKFTFGLQEEGTPHISIEPSDTFKVSYHMEYPAPIGVMDHTFEYVNESNFKKEIAPARTFGFMEDISQLTKMGFASGGNLDNFILLGDGKIINTDLRFKNEFPRHKILDILGDFYLLGKPIRGHIRAHKSGHTQNIGLLKTLANTGVL
jgi:UDP-3-O-[3-hydroxymyristoyl] N-acetylglucosamine deacetylase